MPLLPKQQAVTQRRCQQLVPYEPRNTNGRESNSINGDACYPLYPNPGLNPLSAIPRLERLVWGLTSSSHLLDPSTPPSKHSSCRKSSCRGTSPHYMASRSYIRHDHGVLQRQRHRIVPVGRECVRFRCLDSTMAT